MIFIANHSLSDACHATKDINYTGNPVRLYITLILKVKINIKVQIIEFNCYLFLAIIIIAILLEGER